MRGTAHAHGRYGAQWSTGPHDGRVDEDEAEEKACNLVQGWDNVHDVEVLNVEEN